MMRPVREALSSIFAEKYLEGTPSNESLERLAAQGLVSRELVKLEQPGWFSPGCSLYDDLSWLCQSSAMDLFDPDGATPYYVDNRVLSGSQANQAVFLALMKRRNKQRLRIMSLDLAHGGHLSHGIKSSLIALMHEILPYTVAPQTEQVDYDALGSMIEREQPDLIIYGGSSYPRDWNHQRMMDAASRCPHTVALFDGAHPAGLIAAGLNDNPFSAGVDFVTMTTNKTLCGARGAMVASTPDWAETLARAVFPGLTAGPHGQEMYAKLIGYQCAATESFRDLMTRVTENARCMAHSLSEEHGLRIVTGGTDTHMVLADLRDIPAITGLQVEIWSEMCGIYVTRNAIPFDPNPDQNATSGLRIGVGSISQRGMGPSEVRFIAEAIARLARSGGDPHVRARISKGIKELARAYPIPAFFR
jgi:glycine hydroxymethyltransferase